MRTKKFAIIATSISFLFISGQSMAISEKESETKAKIAVAAEKVNDAQIALADYAFEQRDEYVKKMDEEVQALKNELSAIENKAQHINKQSAEESKKKVSFLKKSIKSLNKQFNALKKSNASNWSKTKVKFNNSMAKVKTNIDSTREWVSKKVAP